MLRYEENFFFLCNNSIYYYLPFMACTICQNTELCSSIHLKWYIEWLSYTVHTCNQCKSSYVPLTEQITWNIYDTVYSVANTFWWYDRYSSYADTIKKQKNPLHYLSKKDSIYTPIYHFLKKNNKPLRILEVWCGYWYLSYALRQSWHTCFWVDISSDAIEYARKSYGDYFYCCDYSDIKNTIEDDKFDLIIATEVIEHTRYPIHFVQTLAGLLKPGWSIIITTPNKSAMDQNIIWHGDQPPVHLSYITDEGLVHIANITWLSYSFFNFIPHSNTYNNILHYIVMSFASKLYWTYPNSFQYTLHWSIGKSAWWMKYWITKFLNAYITRTIFNILFFLYSICYKKYRNLFGTLCIIYKKSL